MGDKKIVVMDVEGVIIPKRRYLLFDAGNILSVYSFFKLLFFGLLYEAGLLPIRSALKKIFRLFKGVSFEELFETFKDMPLIPEAEEFIRRLKSLGYKVAFISSGLPDTFVKYLAKKLKVDFAYGLRLGVKEGRLTGEVEGTLLEERGKGIILERILSEQGFSPSDCVVVVDDRNNLSMFPLSSLRVGYNPDYMISFKSDYVVKGGLLEVLPLITTGTPKGNISIFGKNEVLRKVIHMSASFIPLICIHLLTKEIVALILSSVTLIYIISEIARLRNVEVPVLSTITRAAANKSELYEFITSPINFALGIILSLVFFPEPIGYAAVLTLTLGDSSASIFGKLLGRHAYPFNKGKWMEGTVFGFIFAFIGCLFFLNPTKSFLGASMGMFAETLPLPLDDNLSIPLAAGTIMLLPI